MEQIKFKGAIITIDDRRFTKDFGRESGIFTIEIPLPYEKTSIISATARALGGYGKESFSDEEREYVRMLITLNSVIKEKPIWWEGADKCPDDSFILELWRWYLDCETEFTARLKSKTSGKSLEGSK